MLPRLMLLVSAKVGTESALIPSIPGCLLRLPCGSHQQQIGILLTTTVEVTAIRIGYHRVYPAANEGACHLRLRKHLKTTPLVKATCALPIIAIEILTHPVITIWRTATMSSLSSKCPNETILFYLLARVAFQKYICTAMVLKLCGRQNRRHAHTADGAAAVSCKRAASRRRKGRP